MKPAKPVLLLALALALAACGGEGLSIRIGPPWPPGTYTVNLEFPAGRAVEHRLEVFRGSPPYRTRSWSCSAAWVQVFPNRGVVAGTRPAGDSRTHFCTWVVEDSSTPPWTVEIGLSLTVEVQPLALPADVTDTEPDNILTLKMEQRAEVRFAPATGGLAPYTYDVIDCALPAGLAFSPSTRVLSGTPEVEYRGPNCTYQVTDSASPPASAARSFVLIVEPLDRAAWRFRTRTVSPGGPCVTPGVDTPLAQLSSAYGGTGDPTYRIPDLSLPLDFTASNRTLSYHHPTPYAPPILGTPTTYRYLVGTETPVTVANASDALCLDVEYTPGTDDPDTVNGCPGTKFWARLRFRDDAFWNGTEYRCPDATAPAPRSGGQGASNPVHEALGPVHARRAVDVAHDAVRDRVGGWSPGDPRVLAAFSPSFDFASLSGLAEGFDYSGSSESLSAGAELGADAWQAGLLASFTRTGLRYRAAADLAGQGYRTGEHETEIFSLHPFMAWHARSGGHVWASLGAGSGRLRHRDDLGFPYWSRSDVQLRTWALGGALPLAEVLAGSLEAQADVESFAFEIEGGGRISTSLPTLRGRDYRAGLAWRAPVLGSPALSLAWKRLTGDGPEGTQVEARGSASVTGVLDPRLSLTGSAEASFGLGDYEQDTWRVGGGIEFVSDALGRGARLDLDTLVLSVDEGDSAGVGVRAEAGYGLWGGPFLGVVRPYVGWTRPAGEVSTLRAVGLYLRDTPDSQIAVELYDQSRVLSPGIGFTARQRF